MPHCHGLRAKTRDLFQKGFRKHGGSTPLARVLTTYRKGDFVDIVADGSIHKGMPYKYYHGRTGKVFDVTQNSIGVIVNKQVRGTIIPKRIHVRIEHVRQSKCREAFKERVRQNDAKKREAKKKGEKINTKREPIKPREAHLVEASKTTVEFMNPIKFRWLF